MQRLEQIAKKARTKGLDPVKDIEISPADDVAGRVEGLVGPPGIAERIRELTDTEPAHSVAFEIAREIVHGAQNKGWNAEAAAEQAIRTALAILTEGITAGPIEGIAQVRIKTNVDGSRYLAVYFAGPIRAAGGTEAAQTVIVADAIRQQLDLDRYKPSKENIERYVEEVDLYNRVSHLQYPSRPEEVRLAARNIAVEVTGEPTAEVEVTGYRDSPGVETNRLRGGAILVLNDSILGKAHKLANLVKQLSMPGWDWLGGLIPRELDENKIEQRIQPKEKFLEDIIAGRPVLSYPSRKGGFRVRYGRSRNTGLAALGVHPATMMLLDNFIACGTQLIVERPGKGCIAMPVDTIHGPIVKLNNGSIVVVDTVEEAKQVRDSVSKVLFLGDLLISFGEFRENNHLLVPAGYCAEWWAQDVLKSFFAAQQSTRESLFKIIDKQTFTQILTHPFDYYPDAWQAISISLKLQVPLHPKYLYFWEDLSIEQLKFLQQWIEGLVPESNGDRVIALQGVLDSEIEEILDSLCIPCEVENNQIRFTEAAPILHSLFLGENKIQLSSSLDESGDALGYLQNNWKIFLRPKGTFYIGARIGRPEKAKRRKMSPPPHGIFPVGTAGGPMRDIRKAEKKSLIVVEANFRVCPRCGEKSFLRQCSNCVIETEQLYWCPVCEKPCKSRKCEHCANSTNAFGPIEFSLKDQLNRSQKNLGGRLPGRIKGVKGLMSINRVPEILEKAILRARYDLFVYKDGTIRFDMTDAPLTYFKPCEVSVSVEKLKQLGYKFDEQGASLINDTQILELKTQDIVIPFDCAKYLYRISQFVDDLLVQVYGLDPYYNLHSPEDLVGHLIVGLAPHTSAGVIGRVIGFTPLRVCYAHPFWHAAKRRNCLHGTEEILIWDTQNEQLLKLSLGQVVEELLENGTPTRIVDDFGTLAIENPYPHWRTISIDPITHQPLYQPIKHWIKGNSHHWLKLTTHSGRTITMTPDHNIMTWNRTTQTIERTKAHQLKIGDYVPLLYSIETPSNNPPKSINILQELANHLPKTEKFQTFKHQTRLRNAETWMHQKLHQFALTLYNQQHTSLTPWQQTHTLKAYFTPHIPKKSRIPLFSRAWYQSIPLTHLEILEREGVFHWNEIPTTAQLSMTREDHTINPYLPFTPNLLRLLGYYTAEGYIRDEPACYQTNFSLPHPHIRTHLRHLIQTVFGSDPYYKQDNDQLAHTGRIHAYLLAYALKLGKNALSKRIPNFVFSLPREFRLHFLSALVDGDSSIIPHSCRTTIYTANEKLAKDYSLLLATLGVFARIHQAESGRFVDAVLERYKELGIEPNETVGLFHVDIPGRENIPFLEDLSLIHPEKNERRRKILTKGFPKIQRLSKIGEHVVIDPIKKIDSTPKDEASYCLEVQTENYHNNLYNNIVTTQLINIFQCDGDEDAVMLALDPLINFSREYLPTSRGGTMDTPLVLSVVITPKEIDDEAHNIDGTGIYPLEFYEQTRQFVDPKDVEDIFDLVAHRIVDHRIEADTESYGLKCSHPTGDVNYGPRVTTYTKLKTMEEKVERQLLLGRRIAAVDIQDMAKRLLDSHFLPDIFGNIRAFSTQKFRCTSCNEKFRRIPLSGKCTVCSGNLVLTVTKAGIEKYVDLASRVAEEYRLPLYYKQRLEMAKSIINSLFLTQEDEQQSTLKEFAASKK